MDDLEFIYRLMEKNHKTLGLIPPDAVKKAYRSNRVFVHTANGERSGYLLLGPIRKGRDITIWQICIDENKRKRGYGKDLFKQAYDFALTTGASGFKLRCADNLQAKYFWESLGFKEHATTSGKGQYSVYFLPLNKALSRQYTITNAIPDI